MIHQGTCITHSWHYCRWCHWITCWTRDQGHLLPHQDHGCIQDSTMKTYVHNYRYVVNYMAARDECPASELPMAGYLSSKSAQYRKLSRKSESNKSWQAMASEQQWIQWCTHASACRAIRMCMFTTNTTWHPWYI